MEFPFYWLDDAELCELMSFTHKSFFLLSFTGKMVKKVLLTGQEKGTIHIDREKTSK